MKSLFLAVVAGATLLGGYSTIRNAIHPAEKPKSLKEQLVMGVEYDRRKATREANPTWISFDGEWKEIFAVSQIPYMLGYTDGSGVGYTDLPNNNILQRMPEGAYAFYDERTTGRVLVVKSESKWAIVYEPKADCTGSDLVVWETAVQCNKLRVKLGLTYNS